MKNCILSIRNICLSTYLATRVNSISDWIIHWVNNLQHRQTPPQIAHLLYKVTYSFRVVRLNWFTLINCCFHYAPLRHFHVRLYNTGGQSCHAVKKKKKKDKNGQVTAAAFFIQAPTGILYIYTWSDWNVYCLYVISGPHAGSVVARLGFGSYGSKDNVWCGYSKSNT